MRRRAFLSALAGAALAVSAASVWTGDRRSPDPGPHAAARADQLLRRARVESNPAHALEAERVVRARLDRDPGDYDALRMLAAVLLAQHRFDAALDASGRARAMRPDDAWNDGTSGDAWLELGEYEKAFAAFDRMVARKPNAASYARVSYARELRGDLKGAVEIMRMAAAATPESDREAQAWHAAQIGMLLLRMGRADDAEREFRRAEHYVARHPYARAGAIRLASARGQYREALLMVEEDLAKAPTPELAAWAGDLWARLGDHQRAAEHHRLMERLEREGWASEEPQPAALARLLAERSISVGEAYALAREGARARSDIHTMDALAWAAFKTGRLQEAQTASRAALRTGTREQRILAHAAAIALAAGDLKAASAHASQAIAGGPFDLLAFDEAMRVRDALANPLPRARRRAR